MIFVESRRKSKKTLDRLYPNAEVIDVTSKGPVPFVQLSPFYPHGKIPVPFFQDTFSYSVEGIWQGLKVFEFHGYDPSKFEIHTMKNIKRTVRKFGQPLGHTKGVNGPLLSYISARKEIYIPVYNWVLDNKVSHVLSILTSVALKKDLVLLDHDVNSDIENTKKPLSHAALVKLHLIKYSPELDTKRFTKPLDQIDHRKEAQQQLNLDFDE